MSTLNFDATQVAPQQPMEAIPAGWYKAAVTESELVPTSDGSGTRLKYELTIQEGPFKGRKVFDGFNLGNSNPQAVEIAQQQLSALCHATGVLRVQDSTQLHNIPVGVKISLDAKRTVDALNNATNPATKQPYVEGTAGTKTYDAQNRVKGFKNVNEVTTDNTAPGAAPAAGGPANPTWAVAKPATPGPVAKAAAPVGPGTTSNAVPPWEQNKAAAPAAPVAAPAAPVAAAPKGPKGPKKAPAKAAPERKFFVYFADDNMPLQTEAEVIANFANGMPQDTPLLLEADINSGDWKDAAQYQLGGAAPVAAAPVASNVPPWERKG